MTINWDRKLECNNGKVKMGGQDSYPGKVSVQCEDVIYYACKDSGKPISCNLFGCGYRVRNVETIRDKAIADVRLHLRTKNHPGHLYVESVIDAVISCGYFEEDKS